MVFAVPSTVDGLPPERAAAVEFLICEPGSISISIQQGFLRRCPSFSISARHRFVTPMNFLQNWEYTSDVIQFQELQSNLVLQLVIVNNTSSSFPGVTGQAGLFYYKGNGKEIFNWHLSMPMWIKKFAVMATFIKLLWRHMCCSFPEFSKNEQDVEIKVSIYPSAKKSKGLRCWD